ncbi:MAG: hypothetical protein ABUT20_65640 [Bacteroidota bacterium]
MKLACLSLVIGVIFFACKKNTSVKSLAINWPCDIIEDSAIITNHLPGSWKWVKYTCNTDQVNPADKETEVTFYANGTFKVEENSAIITQGSWHLKKLDTSNWGLDLTAPSEYLKGFVIFCDNQVAFINSYVDGCNNYFEEN